MSVWDFEALGHMVSKEKVHQIAVLPKLIECCVDSLVKVAEEDTLLHLYDFCQYSDVDPVALQGPIHHSWCCLLHSVWSFGWEYLVLCSPQRQKAVDFSARWCWQNGRGSKQRDRRWSCAHGGGSDQRVWWLEWWGWNARCQANKSLVDWTLYFSWGDFFLMIINKLVVLVLNKCLSKINSPLLLSPS